MFVVWIIVKWYEKLEICKIKRLIHRQSSLSVRSKYQNSYHRQYRLIPYYPKNIDHQRYYNLLHLVQHNLSIRTQYVLIRM